MAERTNADRGLLDAMMDGLCGPRTAPGAVVRTQKPHTH